MNECKAQKAIHNAVLDSLSWLDKLPSQKKEILEKTEKEALPLMTASNAINGTTIGLTDGSSVNRPRFQWLKPALVFCTVMIFIFGIWAVYRNGYLNQLTPLDVVSQPGSNNTTPEAFPAAVTVQSTQKNQTQPLDRIDLSVDPDALWNEENGILTEGEKIEKTPGLLPFKNAVYREAYDHGISVEGEMTYQSD